MNTHLWRLTTIVLLSITHCALYAQHLPGIQKGSLHAPANVKTDGKATEWRNKFQAFNNATEVYYTLANDDKNLYLAIQAVKPTIIAKALRGGIVFTINHSTGKSDKQPVVVSFPIYDSGKDGLQITQSINKKISDTRDTVIIKRETDSLMNITNKLLSEKLKKIKVLGTKPVIDTFISVYNEEGFEAAARVDHKRACTIEIAIPLKYLGLPVDKPFAYNVKLNASSVMNNMIINRDGRGNIVSINVGGVSGATQSNGYDTDFWAEYTLKQ